MCNKHLTVQDLTKLFGPHPHIEIYDRTIEYANDREYERDSENMGAYYESPTLYDGDLFLMPGKWNQREVAHIAPIKGGFRLELEPDHQEMQTIDARATAHELGLPFRDTRYDPEDYDPVFDFDPYVFDGSMSVEDYELMHRLMDKDRRELE